MVDIWADVDSRLARLFQISPSSTDKYAGGTDAHCQRLRSAEIGKPVIPPQLTWAVTGLGRNCTM